MIRFENDTERAPQGSPPSETRSGGAARLLTAFTTLLVLVVGCDFLDPTGTENPRSTTDDLARSAEPTAAFLPGLRAQFARALAANVTASEVLSDNYSIHGTGINSVFDEPSSMAPVIVNGTGTSTTGGYWGIQELRALSSFVLDEIVPGDGTATAAQRAEILYYRGMAFVLFGENFTHGPLEVDGAPVAASEWLQRGIADLEASVGAQAGDFAAPARAGIARAHRLLGNAGGATQAAQQVLASSPNLAFLQPYDDTGVSNTPYFFLVERALKEMQPLPRLDFLDPKYSERSTGIPVATAEEMHLILAEAAMAQGSFLEGRGHLVNAIQVALSRPTITFIDGDERLNANLSPRPRDAEIRVRADPNSPFRAGLVQTRPAEVSFSPISGTSLDPDSIAAIPPTEEEALLHAFHLARQEIMLLEGRRMSDLGIRLPIMLREIDQNPNINEGDPGTTVVVPGYIPPQNEMDLFTPASPYDSDDNLIQTEITILHDLNRILAQNRVTAFN